MSEIFRSRIGQLSMASILQLIEHEGLTCWLRAEDTALVGFADGVPLYARTGNQSGREALLALFFLPEGTELIAEQDLRPHGEALGRVIDLVLEGSRRRDLWGQLESNLLVPTEGEATLPSTLEPLRPWLDGVNSLGVAAELAEISPGRIVDSVVRALASGSLRTANPAPPLAPDDSDDISLADLLPPRDERLRILGDDTVPPDDRPERSTVGRTSLPPEEEPSGPFTGLGSSEAPGRPPGDVLVPEAIEALEALEALEADELLETLEDDELLEALEASEDDVLEALAGPEEDDELLEALEALDDDVLEALAGPDGDDELLEALAGPDGDDELLEAHEAPDGSSSTPMLSATLLEAGPGVTTDEVPLTDAPSVPGHLQTLGTLPPVEPASEQTLDPADFVDAVVMGSSSPEADRDAAAMGFTVLAEVTEEEDAADKDAPEGRARSAEGADPPTDLDPAEDDPRRGRQALRGILAELGPQRELRRDAQSRAFLAWAMRRDQGSS